MLIHLRVASLVQSLRREGVRGLYKGVGLSGVTATSYIAVSFAIYDQLNSQLPLDRASTSAWWFPAAKLGVGATAGLVGQVCARLVPSIFLLCFPWCS